MSTPNLKVKKFVTSIYITFSKEKLMILYTICYPFAIIHMHCSSKWGMNNKVWCMNLSVVKTHETFISTSTLVNGLYNNTLSGWSSVGRNPFRYCFTRPNTKGPKLSFDNKQVAWIGIIRWHHLHSKWIFLSHFRNWNLVSIKFWSLETFQK